MDERARIQALINELLAASAFLADPIEGCQDLLRLNITSESQSSVQGLLSEFQDRLQKINGAISALETLLEDGYPTIPQPTFTDAVALDIQTQDRTVSSAAGFFPAPERASTVGITFGQPIPKE